jgi:hypothetical protein
MTFQESGLVFHFPSDWLVRKFDSHHFYRGLSGFGFKGVDFIALPPEGPLLLIEIKNYFNRDPRVNAPVPPGQLPPPDVLADKLHEKSADTLQAILAIQRYYLRLWTYRFFLPWSFRLRRSRSEWVFWTLAFRRAHTERQAQFVCWLESDDGQTDWLETLNTKLKALAFDPPFDPIIVSIANNPFYPQLKVEAIS